MGDLIEKLLRKLENGTAVELVSVVEASGSTPRGAGALLAVFADGAATGTVGGGNVEFEATNLAKELVIQGGNALRHFRFVQGDAASLGMVCGGDVTLHFQYLSPADETVKDMLRDLVTACRRNTDCWLVRRLEGEAVTFMALAGRTGFHDEAPFPENLLQNKAVWWEDWFALPVVKAGRVYIFGGGHVSQALVRAITPLGFRPVVYDDRPEFTDPALFPGAEETFCGPFEELVNHVTVTADDYVVIMTRGHQADYEVLTKTLRSGARYIGCIGSRKKLSICRDRLLEAGFTAEEYARVHAPIGLAIGAETPAEIAVSVAAELIAVRAGLQVSGGALVQNPWA
ncbi:XdhC family protein [Dysosmobacter sp.]|uniref:XdhC family protein n=1 Tax=Dysosmobacter sp. TaxID=2591382 RepID=UPI002A9E855F|nr:XdhC family protein [Dysosmobacter sp.]MDY5613493.1 XdhC family protein [Dysosmobacter sp.]